MDDASPMNLKLYVMGTGPRSVRAIVNVRAACDRYLANRYQLEVIDIALDPARARAQQLIAVPTLIQRGAKGNRRFVGDMSDTRRLLKGLGISPSAA